MNKRKVTVEEYSTDWKKQFDEEAILLQKIFGLEIQMIHHIGSTSVNGLSAKPIIDMMPVVRDITKIDSYNDAIIAIGYEPKGEMDFLVVDTSKKVETIERTMSIYMK